MNWQTIDWETFLPEALIGAALAFLIAFLGWLAAHYLAGKRERKNHRRQQQTDCIRQAWNAIHELFAVSAIQKTVARDFIVNKLAPVVADIQLLGTDEQIQMIRKLVSGIKITLGHEGQDREIDLEPLLTKLRNDLRKDLGISGTSEEILTLKRKRKGGEHDTERP